MQPNERRRKIIELLSLRRKDTMQNLADEFGVSWDTIYFSEKDDGDTLEKVKSMIMDAYAERKHREGKLSNCDQQ